MKVYPNSITVALRWIKLIASQIEIFEKRWGEGQILSYDNIFIIGKSSYLDVKICLKNNILFKRYDPGALLFSLRL
jgi:hypothetical protein